MSCLKWQITINRMLDEILDRLKALEDKNTEPTSDAAIEQKPLKDGE